MPYRRPKSLCNLHPRLCNYKLHRERPSQEVPVVRPGELRWLELRRPVVLVNGAFDMLHATHMRLLFAARQRAGTLVCALDTDEKIKHEKGSKRPIMSFLERCSALNYMPIDLIVPIDSKRNMDTVVEALAPELRVQGADYRYKRSRYKVPKLLVRENPIHTSQLIERCKNA